jgi:predicted nucleic acid-binding protein
MRAIFVDTGFWIALLNPKDLWHQVAVAIYQSVEVKNVRVVTTEMVLTEFMNFFAQFSSNIRQQAATTVLQMQQHPNITIIPQTTEQFNRALSFYMQRGDKAWSLTDCSSFLIMQDLGITEALAFDRHFEQAGFKVIGKEQS